MPEPPVICIVGGGVAGMTSAKTCMDYGLHPVVMEQTDGLGGLWRYKQRVTPGESSDGLLNRSHYCIGRML